MAWPSVHGISNFVYKPYIKPTNHFYLNTPNMAFFPTLSITEKTLWHEFWWVCANFLHDSAVLWYLFLVSDWQIFYVTQFYLIGNQNSVERLIKCQGLRAPHRGSAVIWNGRWIFTCFGSKLNVRRERCQMRPFSCWLTLSPPILWISFTLYSTHSHFNRNYRNIKVKWRGSYPKSCNRIHESILEVSESSSVLSSWQHLGNSNV